MKIELLPADHSRQFDIWFKLTDFQINTLAFKVVIQFGAVIRPKLKNNWFEKLTPFSSATFFSLCAS